MPHVQRAERPRKMSSELAAIAAHLPSFVTELMADRLPAAQVEEEPSLTCECRPGCVWDAADHCTECDKHLDVCTCVVPCGDCGLAVCRCIKDAIWAEVIA